MCARVRARLCDININIRIHIFLCHVPLHSFKHDTAVVCEHYHILVCIDMYAYNSLSVHMQSLKCDPATVVSMIMDSFALIFVPTILSLYVCSLLKCDPASAHEYNHGLVCNYNSLSLCMPSRPLNAIQLLCVNLMMDVFALRCMHTIRSLSLSLSLSLYIYIYICRPLNVIQLLW